MPMTVETIVFWIVIPCALVDGHYHEHDCASPVCLKDSRQGHKYKQEQLALCVVIIYFRSWHNIC